MKGSDYKPAEITEAPNGSKAALAGSGRRDGRYDLLIQILHEDADALPELTRIVRAVNCHDDLVEALKKASDEIAGFRRLRGGYPEDNHEAACDTISVIEEIVDAALAKAKGDTPDEG